MMDNKVKYEIMLLQLRMQKIGLITSSDTYQLSMKAIDRYLDEGKSVEYKIDILVIPIYIKEGSFVSKKNKTVMGDYEKRR